MTTSNTQSIPARPDRTRDMGAVKPDAPSMPFATALDALRALETQYGPAALADAMERLRWDPGFINRKLTADPGRAADIRALAA